MRLKNFISDNKEHFFIGLGVSFICGGVAKVYHTTVRVVKRDPDKSEKDILKDNIKEFLPAGLMVGTGIGMIGTGVAGIDSKLIETTAAYALQQGAAERYKEAVAETVGPSKERQVEQKAAENRIEEVEKATTINDIEETGCGSALFIDDWTGTIFRSSVEQIDKAINKIQFDMNNGFNDAALNELRSEMCLKSVGGGRNYGWVASDHLDKRIEYGQYKGTPCGVLYFVPEPHKI